MRIGTPTLSSSPSGVRATATVAWEGPHRGPAEMWFETDAAHASDFAAAPEAFALAAMPSASALGEPRLAIDAPLCARLAAGLEQSMALFSSWYRDCRAVPVEAAALVPLRPRAERATTAFLSGGVDSLALLAGNRAVFPSDHPASIRSAIFLFGWHTLDFDGADPRPDRRRASEEQRARLEALGAKAGFDVVPVTSNVRTFHPVYELTKNVGFGAGILATAHLFRSRFTDVAFASHGHGPSATPHASHAALDAQHSSGAMQVHFEQAFTMRIAKLRTLVGWPAALDALQVCLMRDPPAPGVVNCGRCEKCRRTALGLFALGRLADAPTFAGHEPPEAMAAAYRPSGVQQVAYARDVAAALDARGRSDLGDLLRTKAGRWERRHRRRRLLRRLSSLVGIGSGPGLRAR